MDDPALHKTYVQILLLSLENLPIPGFSFFARLFCFLPYLCVPENKTVTLFLLPNLFNFSRHSKNILELTTNELSALMTALLSNIIIFCFRWFISIFTTRMFQLRVFTTVRCLGISQKILNTVLSTILELFMYQLISSLFSSEIVS